MFKIVFLTGAGISQPSGIKTFRGNNGLWNEQKIEDVATLSAFYSDPERVINFMNEIHKDILDKQPNKAHLAIAELEKKYEVVVITQNIDDLHEKAGSSNVIHLHGRANEILCLDCKHTYKNDSPIIYGKTECQSCQSKNIKHNIILFQEMLNLKDYNYAYDECYDADLFVQIGTSALVSPACDLVKHAKPERKRVEINLERSRPKSKDKFVFRHYYIGNVIDTIDQFIIDIPNLLPICKREEFQLGNGVKDKDRYKSSPKMFSK